MSRRSNARTLVESGESGWLARGLMGPTSDELRTICRDTGWTFLELDLAGAGTRVALMDAVAEQWRLPDYFGGNWDALDECLGDKLQRSPGGVLRLKHLHEADEMDQHVLVDILNGRMCEAPPPIVVVSDPPLPDTPW